MNMLCMELSVIRARLVILAASTEVCVMFHCDKIEDLERQWRCVVVAGGGRKDISFKHTMKKAS